MTDAEKNDIRRLLFQRVDDPPTRTMIIELASSLCDEVGDDDYWSALYHYALPENRVDMQRDHARFVNTASRGYLPEIPEKPTDGDD